MEPFYREGANCKYILKYNLLLQTPRGLEFVFTRFAKLGGSRRGPLELR